MVLSRARAQSVQRCLVDAGISASTLKAAGFGFSRPLAPNTTEENRARNRRVELKVLASAQEGPEHLHRIREVIAEWAARPDSQTKIERASSPTFVDHQMKKHRRAAKARLKKEKAPKTAAEKVKEMKEEHDKAIQIPLIKRFFESLRKMGNGEEGP